MRITDLLKKESIDLNGVVTTKKETIEKMTLLMEKGGNVKDLEKYRAGVFAREEEGTTGIGEGIAIPHAKTDAVSGPGLAAMIIRDGVDYDSLDGEPVHMVFLIAAPNTEDNIHLEVLSRLSMLLMDDNFRANLMKASTVEEFLGYIDQAEKEKFEEETEEKQEKEEKKRYQILAVTACPTGIAHTYMAREKLLETGEKFGWSVKIETQGSGGVEFALTDEDINAADCVLIASDVAVSGTERFKGKPMVKVPVATAIKSPEHLLRKIEEKLGAMKK